MKKIILIILTIVTSIICYSQKLETEYYFISNDTLLVDHFLTFKNDSVVLISSVPRHMWQYFEKELKYKKLSENLTIYADDSLQLDNYGFYDNKQLKIEGNALLNESQKDLYVVRKDFDKSPNLFIKFDGKEYKIDMGESNSYGLVTKSPKNNRRLKRAMKNIDLDNYETKLIKGFEAYKNFGYKYVFGIIELKQK
ncbi:hypothetical protein [uncultured Draconibacterium sp.]|uniref:hypothetical protein n=1 Tax=uncultured Draconibacterium sp. TaxID=1573823 RepID=UPI0029C707A4|nr:hypothetical protein [uncultured Draconibacterium sp.]